VSDRRGGEKDENDENDDDEDGRRLSNTCGG
jgi:hypothetical protein